MPIKFWRPERPTCRGPRDSSCGRLSLPLRIFSMECNWCYFRPKQNHEGMWQGVGQGEEPFLNWEWATTWSLPSSIGPTPGWMKSTLVSPCRFVLLRWVTGNLESQEISYAKLGVHRVVSQLSEEIVGSLGTAWMPKDLTSQSLGSV